MKLKSKIVMKSDSQIYSEFAANQRDEQLDPVKVLWTGQTISLFLLNGETLGKFLTSFDAQNGALKIMRWCVKNNYRCPQVIGSMIQL